MIVLGKSLGPTPKDLEGPEADLLEQTEGNSVIWCGSATAALFWAYRIVRQDEEEANSEVIIPAIGCDAVAHAALQAGLTPRFADVDPQSGLINLATVEARANEKTRAVVFIHLFGQTAQIAPIAEWCHRHGVTLIEDIAQAQGAHLDDGRPAGSVGDLSVYSFNRTKILECGGGALLTRTEPFGDIVDDIVEAFALPSEFNEERAASLALSYRNLHHALVTLFRHRLHTAPWQLFLSILPAYAGLGLAPMRDPSALSESWTGVSPQLRRRLEKAEHYSSVLSGGPWTLLDSWRDSGVCWRYSLLVDFPDELVKFSEAVRKDGFHVSNLYWPLNDFFRPGDVCPAADRFARRIVNLRVDDSVDLQWVDRCAHSLLANCPR